MKIFGIEIKTKRALKKQIEELQIENGRLIGKLMYQEKSHEELVTSYNKLKSAYKELCDEYPFDVGQIVYDIQFRNTEGKFTKKHPSIEHSLINEVTVTERNYFGLVKRYYARDVFTTYEDANEFLNEFCSDVK